MGGLKKEKGKCGAAVQYYSRKQAMRQLQIGLPNFRRLCIWKGLYPVISSGTGTVRGGKMMVVYKRCEVARMRLDPVLELMRQERVETDRIRRSKARHEGRIVRRTKTSHSVMDGHLARLVRERWPNRESALYSLGDAIESVVTVSHLPRLAQFPGAYIHRCRRLMLELYQYLIRTRAIRLAYISVKGIHLQASISGVPVSWLCPHEHAAACVPPEIDYRLLATQMRLDSVLLQTVLTGLYADAGLVYPPKFDVPIGTELSDRDLLAAMTVPLASIESNGGVMDTGNSDDNSALGGSAASERSAAALFLQMDGDAAAAADKEARVGAVRRLFEGQKVFLGREVPREVFCLALRCCGALVSWEDSCAAGAPFPASDRSITLHVVDRDSVSDPVVSRSYVQPQYIFDSINAARLLPVQDYLPGMRLIAHLSPFIVVDNRDGTAPQYCPPEMRYLRGEIAADELYEYGDEDEDKEEEEEDEEGEEEEEEDEVVVEEMEEDFEEEEEEPEEKEMDIVEPEEESEPKEEVKPSKNKKNQKDRISREELDKKIEKNKQTKLLEMSLPKKRRNLYNKMKFAEKKEKSKVEKMTEKRRQVNRRRSAQMKK